MTPMEKRKRILGIDLGIASCGWAVIQVGRDEVQIIAAGVRCFNAPLVDRTGEPKTAVRRRARGLRRAVRRRRQRMNAVRALLCHHGLLAEASKSALSDSLRRISALQRQPQVTPWTLRSAAQDRLLSTDELAVVLGHIARHRGFQSKAKRDCEASASDKTSKMKEAMEQMCQVLMRYRSFGESLANDPRFADRKRNRDNDYTHTPRRTDLEDEVRLLLAVQRRLAHPLATEALEVDFVRAAFSQRPVHDNADKVGQCPFEANEKRTSRRAPSFELFRYLAKLATLAILTGRTERRLSSGEISTAARLFSRQGAAVTYRTLRRLFDLDRDTHFAGIARDKEDLDVVVCSGHAAAGTCTLRNAVGKAAWRSLRKSPEKLDRAAEILSFHGDIGSIRKGLSQIGLAASVVGRLVAAAKQGAFDDFSGTAHISAQAARNIIPGLREGLVYSEACARAGYDHAARPAISLSEIGSPVTRRALGEAIKQIRAVTREFPIDRVHIELARSVAKSARERRKLKKRAEDRNKEKDRRKEQAARIIGRAVSEDELLRYELAIEQEFKCTYCDGKIHTAGFAANDSRYQVDHILPWGRFGDDSYLNKNLSCVVCNQNKRGRTPYEWFSKNKTEGEWKSFVARLETLQGMKGVKKRNFTLREATKEIEDRFKARNLSDTRWATRLLVDQLAQMFPATKGERWIFARSGAITSRLRRAWGLEGLKKANGERVEDDRHHAVDAIVLAVTTESRLQKMTEEIKLGESRTRQQDILAATAPSPNFRSDVVRTVYGQNGSGGVFVSRAERRRARGRAHDARVKEVRVVEGRRIVYTRKRIEELKEKDLDRIPIPEPFGKIVNPEKLRDQTVKALRYWMAAGRPQSQDNLPRSPKGDIIRKVRVATKDSVAIDLRGGTVDRGDVVRVDVFRKKNRKGRWQYYMVPIYPHQIATMDRPPDRAIAAHCPEDDWPLMSGAHEFMWSLVVMTYIEAVKSNGEVIEGYFRGVDRATGGIAVSPHNNSNVRKRSGARTLLELRKFNVDRLGRKFEVRREIRTWRGRPVRPDGARSTVEKESASIICPHSGSGFDRRES
jgi:CRISPR-associated endonuclease Csn1